MMNCSRVLANQMNLLVICNQKVLVYNISIILIHFIFKEFAGSEVNHLGINTESINDEYI